MKFPHSFALLFSAFCAMAQEDQSALDQLKAELLAEQVFDEYDLSDLVITDVVPSKVSGLTHYYAQQRVQGIPIHGAVLNYSMQDDGVASPGESLRLRPPIPRLSGHSSDKCRRGAQQITRSPEYPDTGQIIGTRPLG